jgi:hypothetical protein
MPQGPERLRFVRLMMVLSSLTPLFLLWAVRGMQPIPDNWLVAACAVLIVVPNVVLYTRVSIAKRRVSIDSRHSQTEFTEFCFLGVC